jgi:hypothetical protein
LSSTTKTFIETRVPLVGHRQVNARASAPTVVGGARRESRLLLALELMVGVRVAGLVGVAAGPVVVRDLRAGLLALLALVRRVGTLRASVASSFAFSPWTLSVSVAEFSGWPASLVAFGAGEFCAWAITAPLVASAAMAAIAVASCLMRLDMLLLPSLGPSAHDGEAHRCNERVDSPAESATPQAESRAEQ